MKGLAKLLAKKGGAPVPPSPDGDPAEEAAAQEFLSAVKDGDAAAVVDAFKSLKAACSYEDAE
mgnify:CR=1 FL=1